MRLVLKFNFSFMTEGGEPQEPKHEIPITTFSELSRILSFSKNDIRVRFTVPKETWTKSLSLDKQNTDPPDEIARTGEGLLEWSQLIPGKITIHSGKSALVSMTNFFLPEFGEEDDEKIQNWKIVKLED
jgi:hypothetical protein